MLESSEDVERLSHRVIGAAIEVHRQLGPGFLESAYEEAMSIELSLRGIAFQRQFEMDLYYKGHVIATNRLDFLIDKRLVVELKAVEGIAPVHVAQTLAYVTACRVELGLILNFNVPALKDGGIRRVIRSRQTGI